jgi:apolipoprotein N-acyltransferase
MWLWAALAAVLLAVGGVVEGAWGLAILAAACFWQALTLARTAARATFAIAIVLLPVPAVALDGLRNTHPLLWLLAVAVVAGGYAVVGVVLAALLQAARARLQPATRPVVVRRNPNATPLQPPFSAMALTLACAAVDQLLMHARPIHIPFPVTPGYALLASPLAPLAAIAGPAALTSAWLTLGLAAHSLTRWRTQGQQALLWGLAVAALLALAWLLARQAAHAPTQNAAGAPAGPLSLTLTQRASDEIDDPIDAWMATTLRADTQLHVWPENAVGTRIDSHPQALRGAARQLGAPLLAGATQRNPLGATAPQVPTGQGATEPPRNVAVFSDAFTVRTTHEKRWLVPHYEAWLTPGRGEVRPLVVDGWRVAVVVCWESLFFDEVRARVRGGADVLVVLAHSAWARGTLTPVMHARAAKLLAHTFGRPVVHVSSGGPSRVSAHDGSTVAHLHPGELSQRVTLTVPPQVQTPYARYGPLGVLALWGVALLLWTLTAWVRPAPTRPKMEGFARRACCTGAAGHR